MKDERTEIQESLVNAGFLANDEDEVLNGGWGAVTQAAYFKAVTELFGETMDDVELNGYEQSVPNYFWNELREALEKYTVALHATEEQMIDSVIVSEPVPEPEPEPAPKKSAVAKKPSRKPSKKTTAKTSTKQPSRKRTS